MDELQSCPNCGSLPKLHKIKNKYYIECDGDCWTSTKKHSEIQDAVKEWNSIRKEHVKKSPDEETLKVICDILDLDFEELKERVIQYLKEYKG